MNFKTLLVETKVFCPSCNIDLYIGNLMFEDESNGQIVCGYCRDDYETKVMAESYRVSIIAENSERADS